MGLQPGFLCDVDRACDGCRRLGGRALAGGFASFCIGMTCGDAVWYILLTAFLGVTALQLGYLAGIVLYFRMVRARGRAQPNIITMPQRH